MILYHGTTEIIRHPDISFSKDYLDFGRGFYLTTFQEQAEKWAMRKALRKQKTAVVNVYELTDFLEQYNILRFENENDKWLDFVCDCRKGRTLYQKYDVVIGPVANDDVFKSVDLYFRGIWDRQKTLDELRYYKMNDQICIISQDILNHELIYQKSYQVKK